MCGLLILLKVKVQAWPVRALVLLIGNRDPCGVIQQGKSAMRVKRRSDPDVRAFQSRHVALWMRSPFSQREYCARTGISRTLRSKWWIWLREDRTREERIKIGRCLGWHRRSTMTNELGYGTNDATSLSPAAVLKGRADRSVARRRRFTEDEKQHFLDLAGQPGLSFLDVAQRYDIALGLVWMVSEPRGGTAASRRPEHARRVRSGSSRATLRRRVASAAADRAR